MKVSAVHFNPKIAPHLRHNDRTNTTSENIFAERTHLNQCTKSAPEVLKEIDKLYKEAMEKQKGKKGKKTPKERSYHEAIFEINQDTTLEQCQELADKIAELTGFRVLQVALHKDEGHLKENGEFETHYHAHAVFFTLDKNTGKQLARQEESLSKWKLSKMQDLASEVLGMQRGEERLKRGEKKIYIQDYKAYKAVKQEEARAKNALESDLKAKFASREENLAYEEEKLKFLILETEKQQNQREQELNERETKLKSLIETLKSKETNLTIREDIINKRERSIQEQIKDIETKTKELQVEREAIEKIKVQQLTRHYKAFENLSYEFSKRKSFIKNIFTFGKYHQKLEKEFEVLSHDLQNAIGVVEKKATEENHRISRELEWFRERNQQLSVQAQQLERENNQNKATIDTLRKEKAILFQELKKYQPMPSQEQTQTQAQEQRRTHNTGRSR